MTYFVATPKARDTSSGGWGGGGKSHLPRRTEDMAKTTPTPPPPAAPADSHEAPAQQQAGMPQVLVLPPERHAGNPAGHFGPYEGPKREQDDWRDLSTHGGW